MSNNIRKHLPAGYNNLVKDWKAFERWRDPRYLLDKFGDFFQRYMEKFNDKNLKHPFDVVNMIW